MNLHITNETARLKAIVLGQCGSMGPEPALGQTYDAKSYETVSKGIYPTEEKIGHEMSELKRVLQRYDVTIYRPHILENCNQVFARDVAFVVDDKIIVSNIIPDRNDEKEAYEEVFSQISYSKIYNLPEKAHVEGGDVVLYDNIVFLGIYTAADYPQLRTARTNIHAFNFLKELLPEKTIIPLELHKHDTNPRAGILHLDCCFQPVGKNKAIVYRDGFIKESDYQRIVDIFGFENLFHITQEEMYYMNANVFSIAPDVVVSENNFKRLNAHLTNRWGITVETVPYHEISKMGGLLRCSTLPLMRM
ncbi:MAG: amidinotransferase [Dysgonamonadaceae bacterium]|jgi:N-dimethylarginine dimethylaminohydrolase|nr:amidinotransferase [Dysgonamonadaceae bacterium]